MYMYPIREVFRDRAISLYSSKIFDKKEILNIVSNTGVYSSNVNVGTVYLEKNISKNPIVNINALRSSCEDIACCSSECILTFLNNVLHSKINLPRKPFGIGHMYIYTFCLE
jgi:hypothetical protein